MKILSLIILFGTAVAAADGHDVQETPVTAESIPLRANIITKEEVIKRLTEGMCSLDSADVIRAVGKVDPLKYPEFIQTCNALVLPSMNGIRRAWLIAAVAKISPSRYDQAFSKTCKDLITPDMGIREPGWIVAVVAKLDTSEYTGFAKTCKDLITPDMNNWWRAHVITSVSKINPLKYPEFTQTCRDLIPSPCMDDKDRAEIIYAVGKVDSLKYPEFTQTCNALFTQDMDSHNRANIIATVGYVPEPLWQFMVQYMRQNPSFFKRVPTEMLKDEMFLAQQQPLTEASLRQILDAPSLLSLCNQFLQCAQLIK